MSNKKQSRRKFIDTLLGTGLFLFLSSILYPVAKYLVPPKITGPDVNSVEVGILSEFKKGMSKIIRMGRKPILVFRQKNGDVKALSATCTHLDCNVQFKSETEQIWCACHNGYYDTQGRNISGPPPRPLGQFPVVLKGDKIIVTKGEVS